MKNLRILVIVIFLVGATTMPSRVVHAEAWGTNMLSSVWQFFAEQAARELRDITIAAAKQAAIYTINQTINNLLTGGSPRFVTNWYDYLYGGPTQRTQLYMNDYFTFTTRGRDSAGNYYSASSALGTEGIRMNYEAYLAQQGRVAVGMGGTNTGPQVTASDYCTDPQNPFADGTWRCFNALISNPYNNPIGYALQAQQEYVARQQMETAIALQEVHNGFLPKKDAQGNIITPSSLTSEISVLGVRLPFEALANADSAVLSTAAQAIAIRAATQIILQGIGTVQADVQRSINKSMEGFSSGLGQYAKVSGPGVYFNPFGTSSSSMATPPIR